MPMPANLVIMDEIVIRPNLTSEADSRFDRKHECNQYMKTKGRKLKARYIAYLLAQPVGLESSLPFEEWLTFIYLPTG